MSSRQFISPLRPFALLCATLLLLWLTCQWNSARRIATPFNVGLVPTALQQAGFAALEGAQLDASHYQLTSFQAQSEAIRAYRNGLLDAVSMDLDSFVQLIQHDPKHRVVLVLGHRPAPIQDKADQPTTGPAQLLPTQVLVVPANTAQYKRLTLRNFARGWLDTIDGLAHQRAIADARSAKPHPTLRLSTLSVNLHLFGGPEPALERLLRQVDGSQSALPEAELTDPRCLELSA